MECCIYFFQCFAFAITFPLRVRFFYIIGLFLVKYVSFPTDLVCVFFLEHPSVHFFTCDFSLKLWNNSIWQSEECQECWVLCSALISLGCRACALRRMCLLSVLKAIECGKDKRRILAGRWLIILVHMAVERHPANGGWKWVEWMQARGTPRRVVDGVGECCLVWSARSLLKKVQHHLAFTVYFPVG